MNDPKPGWQTTEFWAPLVSLVVTALVALHYVPPADQGSIAGWLSALCVGVATVVGNVLLILHYIRSRTTVKQMMLASAIDRQRLWDLPFMTPPGAAPHDSGSGECSPPGQCAEPKPTK